jgi:predicted metal-dependent peptidase
MADHTLAQSIGAALMRICARNSFFGTLVLQARLRSSEQVPTAATDGRDIFINDSFFERLTPPEREAVLLHEVLHAALQHVPRRSGRDPKLWNIAADIVINGMLVKAGYQLPEGGLRDQLREHLSAEEVYELLLRDGQQQQTQPAAGDLLEEAPADASEPTDQSTPAGKQPADANKQPTKASEQWQQALEEAQMVARSAKHGSVPQGMQRELGMLAPGNLDWRSMLWRYMVRSPVDFQGFDRRFIGERLYLDALEIETIRVAIAVDTSGSINQGDLHAFLGEVRAVLRAYPHLVCTLYYADTALYGPHRLSIRGPIPPAQGGGGTDFRPFFERVGRPTSREQADVLIYLTDGWGSFPTKPPTRPVLWVVTPGGADATRFPFGQVARLIQSGHPRGQPRTGWTNAETLPRMLKR